jgi:tape measure domain-containing protein
MSNTFITYTLNINSNINNVLQQIGVTVGAAKRDVDNLGRSADNLNKINLSGFFSSIQAISAVLQIGEVLAKTIQSGMEQEMRNTSFEVLFGMDSAKKMIDEISGYAAKSPYGKAGLSEAVQMMAGLGVAQDKIIPNLRMIGDIAMGDEQKFKSLSSAFAQISSAGKLTENTLTEMITNQFNPLSELEKITGRTTTQLEDMMSQGLISSDMVTLAFESATAEGGRYYGVIDKINNTVGGQLTEAMGNLQEKMLSFCSDFLQPVLLPALKVFNQLLEDPIGTVGRLLDKVTDTYPVISGAIIAITAAVAAYSVVAGIAAFQTGIVALQTGIVALQTSIATFQTTAWTTALGLLKAAFTANPVGLIVAGVAALIAVIAFLITKIDGWGKAWEHTVNGAKLIFLSYVEYVKTSFNTVVDGIMIGINKIMEGWYTFKKALGIGDSSENQKMLEQLRADTKARQESIVDGSKKTIDLAKQAAQEFMSAAGSLSWKNTTPADVANEMPDSIIKKSAISLPGIPGTDFANVPAAGVPTAGIGTATGGSAGKETAAGIATGGTKTTHVTINLGSLISGGFTVNSKDLQDSAIRVRDVVLDELTRVLSMAQGQAI